MTREIKFRIWYHNRTMEYDTKDWHIDLQGNLFCFDSDGGGFTKTSRSFSYQLMQFTGLKDKNGKDIYEGDIVRDKPGEMKEIILEVKYNEMFARFDLWDRGTCSRSDLVDSPTCYEVIGNIYENPELLK